LTSTEIITHDIAQQAIATRFSGAHKGRVTGLTWAEGGRLISCGVDRTVKIWDTTTNGDMVDNEPGPSTVCLLLSGHHPDSRLTIM
jgi:WD repeat and SOF domain-containing protein 1